MMSPSPQLMTVSGTKPIGRLKEISEPCIEGPIELCCPITLELFEDLVKTLHG